MTDHWRGWPIYWDGKYWRYKDNDECVRAVDRPCGACGKKRTPEGHDPCLGKLPRVMNACCGHGNENEAYVQLSGGGRLSGKLALTAIQFLKAERACMNFWRALGRIKL